MPDSPYSPESEALSDLEAKLDELTSDTYLELVEDISPGAAGCLRVAAAALSEYRDLNSAVHRHHQLALLVTANDAIGRAYALANDPDLEFDLEQHQALLARLIQDENRSSDAPHPLFHERTVNTHDANADDADNGSAYIYLGAAFCRKLGLAPGDVYTVEPHHTGVLVRPADDHAEPLQISGRDEE